MSRLIDGAALYERLAELEELARDRVLDTDTSLPYPTNLNPAYTRYSAQLDERTRLKQMIADAPTIESERKKGKWIYYDPNGFKCSECGGYLEIEVGDIKMKFCPNCGSYNGGEEDE